VHIFRNPLIVGYDIEVLNKVPPLSGRKLKSPTDVAKEAKRLDEEMGNELLRDCPVVYQNLKSSFGAPLWLLTFVQKMML